MPNGVRPGERRGGRKKGTPNRATRECALLAKRVVEEQQGNAGRRLAYEILDEFMHCSSGWRLSAVAPHGDGAWRHRRIPSEKARSIFGFGAYQT
jgi:hypothetical protein